MDRRKLKIAVVGCGAVSTIHHLPTILSSSNFSLAGLVDSDKDRIALISLRYGLSPDLSRNLDELSDVDAAIVAVPPTEHCNTVTNLLNQGIHVLCEKPIATTLEDAKGMCNAAESANRILAIGFQRRFSPNTQLLKLALENSIVGEILHFDLVDGFRAGWAGGSAALYSADIVPGGVLYESAIHWLDRLAYLFGKPVVTSYQDDRLGGVESNAILKATFSQNKASVRGSARFSWTDDIGNGLEVTGTDGRLMLTDRTPSLINLQRSVNGKQFDYFLGSCDAPEANHNFSEQLAAFFKAISHRESPIAMGVDGLCALKMIFDAYEMRESMPQPWVFSGLLEGCPLPDKNGNR